jgi:hypothetical protein
MLVELLRDLFTYDRTTLLATFQEDGSSDYFTWYIRLITAGMYMHVYLCIYSYIYKDKYI